MGLLAIALGAIDRCGQYERNQPRVRDDVALTKIAMSLFLKIVSTSDALSKVRLVADGLGIG